MDILFYAGVKDKFAKKVAYNPLFDNKLVTFADEVPFQGQTALYLMQKFSLRMSHPTSHCTCALACIPDHLHLGGDGLEHRLLLPRLELLYKGALLM